MKYKQLEDKLLYVEAFQRNENLRLLRQNGREKETLEVLDKFIDQGLHIPVKVIKGIEFHRVDRIGKVGNDGKPRPIIPLFRCYEDRELVFSKSGFLRESQYGMSAD